MTDRHQAPSYPLRMPPELKERMAEAAKSSGRSLHSEIIARLQSTFRPEQQNLDLGLEPLKDEIQGLRREMQSHQQWIESLKKSGANVRLNDQGQLTGLDFELSAEQAEALLKRGHEEPVPLESVDKPIDASQLLGTFGADEEEIQPVPEFVKKLGSVVYPTRGKGTVKKSAK